jgi:nitrogen fixation protein NifQ
MCSDKSREEARRDIYAWLMTRSSVDENSDLLARIYASWLVDDGVLPDWLGLDPETFRIMMAHHFPFYEIESIPNPGRGLDLFRAPETDDLFQLLIQGRTHGNQSEMWMAQILVTGCMGSDHLWQDLGLWSRHDLSRLMTHNFKTLAAANSRDMKWKKFLYKQLCSAEGVYVCRAPSCEVCADYSECFGSDE